MAELEGIPVQLEMPTGQLVWVRVSTPGASEPSEYGRGGESDHAPDPGFAQDTGGRPWIRPRRPDPAASGSAADTPRLTGFTEAIGGIAQSVWTSLRSVRPDTVEIEFGLDIDASTGQAVSLIADVHANSSVKVKLGWDTANRAAGAVPFVVGDPAVSPPEASSPAVSPPAEEGQAVAAPGGETGPTA